MSTKTKTIYYCDLCRNECDPTTMIGLTQHDAKLVPAIRPKDVDYHVCENCATSISIVLDNRSLEAGVNAVSEKTEHHCPTAGTSELNCHCKICEEHAQIGIERSRPCE